MRIKQLSLLNFRNYRELEADFPDSVTLIIGENGSGKTNILESIYFLSTTKSFRTSSDRDLVLRGESSLKVGGSFLCNYGSIDVTININNEKKELKINGITEKKLSGVIGKILIVPMLFDDIMIITGSPGIRRKFFDAVLSMTDYIYFDKLKSYLAVIKHKNSMLRGKGGVSREMLDVWNEKMAEYGSYLVKKRIEVVDFFNRKISDMVKRYMEVQKNPEERGRFDFSIAYSFIKEGKYSEEDIRVFLMERLKALEEKEIQFETSLVGPHRDDYLFYKNNSQIKRFGSIGEIRFSSIILKLCQFEYYKNIKNEVPILLIDDIFLELDENSRFFIWDITDRKAQKILTTTDLKNLPDNIEYEELLFVKEGNIWKKRSMNL